MQTADFYREKGKAAMKEGRWDEAVAHLTLALNKDKTDGAAYLRRAVARCIQAGKKYPDGNYDEVVADASLAIAVGKEEEDKADATLVRGYGYYMNGDYESVKKDYRGIIKQAEKEGEAISLVPRYAPVYELLGNIYAKRTRRKDVAMAVKFFEAAISAVLEMDSNAKRNVNAPSLSLLEKYHEACKKLRTAED